MKWYAPGNCPVNAASDRGSDGNSAFGGSVDVFIVQSDARVGRLAREEGFARRFRPR
jgi:hypothetical protein